MNISDLMSKPATTIDAESSIMRAIGAMSRTGVGFLPVVRDGRAVGVVTGRDIAVRATSSGADLSKIAVSAIMTAPAVTIPETDDLEDALILMRSRNVRRLVVMNAADRVAGVIDLADLAGQLPDASLAKNLQRHAEAVLKGTLFEAWAPVTLSP